MSWAATRGEAEERAVTLGHWVPFVVWVGAMLLPQVAGCFGWTPRLLAPVLYGFKTLLCAGLLLYWRPWRVYAKMQRGEWLPGVVAGMLVAFLWLLPESLWLARHGPELQHFYHRWLIMPIGTLPSYYDPLLFPALPAGHPSLAFAAAEAGWLLTLLKLFGSVVVIAAIEEYFFRGFLYRWLRGARFLEIPLDYDATAFWIVVALFAIEHDRWLLGAVAGAVYGWLALRRGGVTTAIIAHATTNLVIGIVVITEGRWGFW